MHFDPNDRQSLTARVYEHIREDIIEGRYANGAYLVETKLAEELDVSRTPIREALKQLLSYSANLIYRYIWRQ